MDICINPEKGKYPEIKRGEIVYNSFNRGYWMRVSTPDYTNREVDILINLETGKAFADKSLWGASNTSYWRKVKGCFTVK